MDWKYSKRDCRTKFNLICSWCVWNSILSLSIVYFNIVANRNIPLVPFYTILLSFFTAALYMMHLDRQIIACNMPNLIIIITYLTKYNKKMLLNITYYFIMFHCTQFSSPFRISFSFFSGLVCALLPLLTLNVNMELVFFSSLLSIRSSFLWWIYFHFISIWFSSHWSSIRI